MEDMMDKSFEELPTETFLELKRKRIRENRIHELESNIQDDIESALHIAEHEIMRQHFDTIQGDDGEEDFFDSCFSDYTHSQKWEIKMKLITDIAKMFVEAKTARIIAEGLNREQ